MLLDSIWLQNVDYIARSKLLNGFSYIKQGSIPGSWCQSRRLSRIKQVIVSVEVAVLATVGNFLNAEVTLQRAREYTPHVDNTLKLISERFKGKFSTDSYRLALRIVQKSSYLILLFPPPQDRSLEELNLSALDDALFPT
jgi:hypothetical protein